MESPSAIHSSAIIHYAIIHYAIIHYAVINYAIIHYAVINYAESTKRMSIIRNQLRGYQAHSITIANIKSGPRRSRYTHR